MLGQPRKYGCHQKKLPPIPLRGSYDALKSSRYCPVPRATVQFLALLSSFLALLSSFLMLLSSFLELLSSFLELLSSSSRYCPVSSRYCPVSSRYCPVPHATVQFLALLSSSSRYCPVSSSYCPVLIFLFWFTESRVHFCNFFFVRLFILLYQYTYSFKSNHFFS